MFNPFDHNAPCKQLTTLIASTGGPFDLIFCFSAIVIGLYMFSKNHRQPCKVIVS